MPAASPAYCKSTPVSRMGFTQRSSCRAQGLIPRSDGSYRKSPKYKVKGALYDSGKRRPRTRTGYGNRERALMTIKNIKSFPISYQKQVVNTLYNRAKYHKYQNQGMRDAMKIFEGWIKKNTRRKAIAL